MLRDAILTAVPYGDNATPPDVAERLDDVVRLRVMVRGMAALNLVALALVIASSPARPWLLLGLVAALTCANEAVALRARRAEQIERRLVGSALLLMLAAFVVLHGDGGTLGLLAFVTVLTAYGPVLRTRSILFLAGVSAAGLLADVAASRLHLDVLPGEHVEMSWTNAGLAGLILFEIAVMAFVGTRRLTAARTRAQALLNDLQVAQQRLFTSNRRLERWNEAQPRGRPPDGRARKPGTTERDRERGNGGHQSGDDR